MLFLDEFAGGEFDGVGVAVLGVRSAGEFDGGVMVADGESNFLGDKIGVRSHDGGANNGVVFLVGEKLDEAVIDAVDFAGSDFAEINEGFFVFAIAF